jgi:hypothetical protein
LLHPKRFPASVIVKAAKVAVPRAVNNVIDRAIQVHGAAGISDATPLSMMYGWHRAMRIFDGPDEAHLTTLARAELTREPLFDLPPTIFDQMREDTGFETRRVPAADASAGADAPQPPGVDPGPRKRGPGAVR